MVKYEYIDWMIMITCKPKTVMTISSILKDANGKELNKFYYWQGIVDHNEEKFGRMGLRETTPGIWQANVKKIFSVSETIEENNNIAKNVKINNKIVKILHGVFDSRPGGKYAMER